MATRVHDLLEHPELQQGLLECRDRFLGYVRKRVADPELAEDILQDSLLRAIQAAPSLRQRDRLVPWFYSDLPNTIAVVVTTSLQVSAAILVEAGLGFLGLGDRTVVSWGNMLNAAQPVIRVA